MNVGMQLKDNSKKWTRRLAVPMLALALVGSFATYECVKPAAAKAAEAAPLAPRHSMPTASARCSPSTRRWKPWRPGSLRRSSTSP